MCRFLIIKSEKEFKPKNTLSLFAGACKKSIAPDGELQKDGYGIVWMKSKLWQTKKSLTPIWEERSSFSQIPETKLLVVHARGAGFDKDRGNIDFNEPFIDGELCFVFNGIIRKVKLNLNLEGKIGSQKLLSLVKLNLKDKNLEDSLKNINKLIIKNSEKIEGMNIGLIKEGKISVLCQYSDNKNYYSLNYYQDAGITIISSEVFGAYNWRQLEKGEIKTFI